MKPLYLMTVLATAAILAASARKVRLASLPRAIGRVFFQMAIIGIGVAVYVITALVTRQYGLISDAPLRDATALTLLSYLYVNRREIDRSLAGTFSIVVVAACSIAIWYVPTQYVNVMCVIAIPALLPLLSWVGAYVTKRITPFTEPSKRLNRAKFVRLGVTHFTTSWIEIARAPGELSLSIRYSGDVDWGMHNWDTKSWYPDACDLNVPLLLRDGQLPVGMRWRVNPVVSTFRRRKTISGTSCNSTFIAGTTSFGMTSSGDFVTMHTPGTTIHTPGESYSYDVDAHDTLTHILVRCDDAECKLFIGNLYDDELEEFELVMKVILDGCQERVEFLNDEERRDAEREEAEQRVAQNIQQQEATRLRTERMQTTLDRLCTEAGLDADERFVTYAGNSEGGIDELLATDRAGNGVLVAEAGSAVWMGSWRRARAAIDGTVLAIVVDDPAYRTIQLAERRHRFTHLKRPDKRQEWADRINLIAGCAAGPAK